MSEFSLNGNILHNSDRDFFDAQWNLLRVGLSCSKFSSANSECTLWLSCPSSRNFYSERVWSRVLLCARIFRDWSNSHFLVNISSEVHFTQNIRSTLNDCVEKRLGGNREGPQEAEEAAVRSITGLALVCLAGRAAVHVNPLALIAYCRGPP